MEKTGSGPLWKTKRQLCSPSLHMSPAWCSGSLAVTGKQCVHSDPPGCWEGKQPSQLESGVPAARVVKGILRMSPLCSKQQGRTERREEGSWNGRVQSLMLTSAGPLLRSTRPAWPRAEGRAAPRSCVCLVVVCLIGGMP